MRNGVVDLDAYNSKPSFSRLRTLFYFYDKLYTYNFYEFERDQLHRAGGSVRHYNNIKLLIDHGFIQIIDKDSLDQSLVEDNRLQVFLNAIEEGGSKYTEKLNKLKKLASLRLIEERGNIISEQSMIDFDYSVSDLMNSQKYLISIKERLYSILIEANLQQVIHPTLSMDSFNSLNFTDKKSLINIILLNNIPTPDDSVPLIDIVQYKNENSNKLHYKRLLAWINKLSKEDFNEVEIREEVDWLIEEYKRELKLTGMKKRLINIEFAFKAFPNLLEKLLKLKFSELFDPSIKMRQEKISLFQDEAQAKGNELAYIINLQR
jgi:hypothetical protein